jgi:uncharacterized membrane protein
VSTKPKPAKPSYWIVRIARGHVRLFAAVAVGIAVFLLLPGTLLPGSWSSWTRLLVAWDVGLLYYLATTATMMAASSHADIQRHSADQDEGAFGLMVLTIAAAAASFGAIFAELAEAKGASQSGLWPHLLAIGTIILSWTFTHTIFALHYAYDYYGKGERTRGLDFPATKDPDYWDFVYFAFVLGMTFQVSDVAVTNKWIRRTATVHGVLAFFFNATVIALTVNMAANAF